MNDGAMCDWLRSHANCVNFAFCLSASFENAWPTALNNLDADASAAGFLGVENEPYTYTYVCQQNAVSFTPTGSSGSYYGVWNGSRYTGPVDPSTSGAVLCWLLMPRTPTGQLQDDY